MRKLKLELDGLRMESFATCGCPSWSGPECNTVCIG